MMSENELDYPRNLFGKINLTLVLAGGVLSSLVEACAAPNAAAGNGMLLGYQNAGAPLIISLQCLEIEFPVLSYTELSPRRWIDRRQLQGLNKL